MTPRKTSRAAVSIVFLAVFVTAPPLPAEVLFGMHRSGGRTWETDHDLAHQGRFFATSDYDFKPGGPDPFLKTAWGYKRFTRGQVTAELPAGTLRHLLPESQPWVSGPERTLFGVAFEKPFAGDALPPGRPIRFDRLEIAWGATVPAPGAWGGLIVTEEGDIVRLPVDKESKLYPYDKTEMRFDPVTVRTLYLAKEAGDPRTPAAFAQVNGLKLYAAEKPDLTNHMVVWQPDFYACIFDTERPGSILKIFPMCEFFNSIPAFGVTSTWPMQPGILSHVQPILVRGGEAITAAREEIAVRHESADGVDTVRYRLAFEVPGRPKRQEVDVVATFRRTVADSLTLALTAVGTLPPDSRLAVRFRGAGDLYSGAFGGKDTVEFAAGAAVTLDTPAGEVRLAVSDGAEVTVAKDKTDHRGQTKNMTIWQARDYYQQGDYVFRASAPGGTLSVTLGLPLFEKAKPAEQRFTFREAPASSGGAGIAPFESGDLELVETIRCGDPADPHTIYDVTNDPRRDDARFRAILRDVKPYSLDVGPLVDRPGVGAVPITTVAGQPCRAIPDEYGAYFRYALNTDFEVGAYYLLVIEHAFDQTRRGSLEITAGNGIFSFFTRSGLDTGAAEHDGTFRKECILFRANQYFRPVPSWEIKKPLSLWITNTMQWQGWIKAPGPAVRSIEIHKVKTMPVIPDLDALLPRDAAERRHVGSHTQYFQPEFHRVDERLTGLDQVWSNISCASVFTSGMVRPPRYPSAGDFHPGSLDAYVKALELADRHGATLKTYLSQVLHWGYPEPRDAFVGFVESGYASYNWEDIPLSPTPDERAVISESLARAMPALARSRALQVVAMCDTPGYPFTLRNLADFTKETGHKVEARPVVDRDVVNAAAILAAGPETISAWIKWSGEKRKALVAWLRDEIRRYRPDLTLMLNAEWTRGVVHPYWNNPPEYPLSKANLARHGLTTYADSLRFCGYDPALYRGEPGIALQIHAGWPAISLMGNNYRTIEVQHGQGQSLTMTGAQGPAAPDFSGEPWIRELAASFPGGLNWSLSISSEESSKPWSVHVAHCFKNGRELRQSMMQGLLLNARFVDMETYAFAWSGRIAEIRRFAVPFRLLPFTPPEPYPGTLQNASATLLVRRHGDRYALMNADDRPAKAVLGLPPGVKELYDLSDGVVRGCTVSPGEAGGLKTELDMEPWSLRVLTARKP